MILRRRIGIVCLCCLWSGLLAGRSGINGRNETRVCNEAAQGSFLQEYLAMDASTFHELRAKATARFNGAANLFKASVHAISMVIIVKAICVVSNVLSQLSPYPVVKQIQSQHHTSEIDAAPLVALAYSSSQWCFYGAYAWFLTQRPGFLVIIYSNCLGVCLGLYYVWTYHWHCKQTTTSYFALRYYYNIALSLIVMQFVALKLVDSQRMMLLSGLVSSLCSFVSGLTPLEVLPKVRRSQSSAPIPVALVMAFAISSMFWVICGVMLSDMWIIVPNTSTTLVNLYIASFVFIYPRDPAPNDESLPEEQQGK
eukprot:TRINITY_DN29317_c0_g2_i1.p1 TRINITY_DN29317_c0_g2~~TRINITY_DN29317_c0_g2_i1.p1  ORF type:complete len:311 (+),score=43.35 TRINITY_DN29317_c0_g2_i1:262-1194(+)